ncbi:MAG: S-adenosylmethionine synthetase N-terminal domain-containing protein [Candidatus Izemoplasmatales bacterium]|nr:S-adenosylmethionine synthetase N-terminal domain-containing protein [Candidatus Izemoplasmatales bacterium]
MCLKTKTRVAVEAVNKDDLFMIFGKVTTTASVSYGKIAKKVVKEIGYEDDCIELEKISKQSPDISIGVTGSSTHK